MAANMDGVNVPIVRDEAADKVQQQFYTFLSEYKDDNDELIYLNEIRQLNDPERNTIYVDFAHLERFSEQLAQLIALQFYRFYPYLTRAVALKAIETGVQNMTRKEVYVSMTNFSTKYCIRELTSDRIGTLMRISGQIVRTHPVHPELSRGVFVCDECGALVKNVEQQFKYTQPAKCNNGACPNRQRFTLDVHKSVFVDFQKVRIQETQSELPRGSIPRSVEIILRGECVEMAQPGDRCDFTGTLIVVPDVGQLATPGARAELGSKGNRTGAQTSTADQGVQGLKALGVRDLSYKMAFLACALGGIQYTHEHIDARDLAAALSESEKAEIYEMVNDRALERHLVDSLFPQIYGHDEVKRGVLLMLFGGVGKRTIENTTLRGDINVCLVGDPSTAKSQVLKTIEAFCPRAVYTSGKASTAAGLTAAVVKDEESYEFVIEAGALMLADNGVCCIDEFDKMDPKDQVAIHEAMEQQTISITKAGVKATLNARTSILAAANPIGGRYDRAKSLRHNIQMSAPIMSRFDLFFVLVDECNEVTDYAIARRILDVHEHGDAAAAKMAGQYDWDRIRRYIMFARCFQPVVSDTECAPLYWTFKKITPAAGEALVREYKRLRVRDTTGGAATSWRITVRQLESLIRLSEALARLNCTNEITPVHVERASRLLHKSIVRVEQPDVAFDEPSVEQPADEPMDVDNRENIPPPQPDAGPEDASADDGAAKKINRKHLKLSYDEYKNLTNLLVLRLRQLEETASDDDLGTRQSQLVDWYLETIADEVNSEDELLARKTLVERVITRLCVQDNILIQLTTTALEQQGDAPAADSGADKPTAAVDSDPILIVHPNYVVD